MVMPDGNVKVTDFGIARLVSAGRTQTGTLLGTPNYMSPEQISGHAVDGRSDLFSLGVVLYVLLTGERPFQGDSMATLMYMITNQPHAVAHHKEPKFGISTEAVLVLLAFETDIGLGTERDLQCAGPPRLSPEALARQPAGPAPFPVRAGTDGSDLSPMPDR